MCINLMKKWLQRFFYEGKEIKKEHEVSLKTAPINEGLLREVWRCMLRLSPTSETQYLTLSNGAVAFHTWDTKNNHFYILNPIHGIAEFCYENGSHHILRCDSELYREPMSATIAMNYPSRKYHNVFSLNIDKNKSKKREENREIWKKIMSDMSSRMIQNADWGDIGCENIDGKQRSALYKKKNDVCPNYCANYYVELFFPWFQKVNNTKYCIDWRNSLVPPPGDFEYVLLFPSHFLDYPLQEWVKALEYYNTLSPEIYVTLYGNDFPLTPEIPHAAASEEISLCL